MLKTKKINYFINYVVKKDWSFVLMILLITRIFLIIIGLISVSLISQNPETVKTEHVSNIKIIDIWYNWGSLTYYKITTEGYDNIGTRDHRDYAHFPILPLIMNLFFFIFGKSPLAGLIIINLFFYFAILLFLKIIKMSFSDKISRKSIIFIFIFPSTLFFSNFMSESIFLFFLMLGLYALKKNNFLLAGISGMFLSATRIVGIAFFISSLSYIYFQRKKIKNKNFLWLLLSPLGLIFYGLYLKILYGNPWIFISVQEHWGRETNFLSIDNFFNILNLFIDFSLGNLINLFFLILGIVAIIWCWKKWDKSYAIFGVIVLFMPILSASLLSMSRLILVIFPIYVMMANFSEKKYVYELFIVLSSMLMSLWTIVFVNGYWIA